MTRQIKGIVQYVGLHTLYEYFWVVILFIVALGVRFYFVLQADFPLNDGGMFYQIIQDILDHGFRFFPTISYNFSDIPFAYPPLPFYIAALLHELLNIEVVTILQFLPPLLSSLSIPATYVLLKVLELRTNIIIVVLWLFALMPSNILWFIMGGGLTRAMGLFFALLAAASTIWVLKQFRPSLHVVSIAVFFIIATALSHLEALIFFIIIIFCWACVYSPRRATIQRTLVLALLSICGISPWLLGVSRWHGIGPFLAAAASNTTNVGGQPGTFVTLLFNLYFTREMGITLINTLALLGIAVAFIKRSFFPLLLLCATLLFMSRSALNYTVLSLGILVGMAIDSLYTTYFNKKSNITMGILNGLKVLAFGVVIFYVSGTVLAFDTLWQRVSISDEQRETMGWVANHVSPDANFVIISDSAFIEWATDADAEWFPVIAQRYSVTTVQGSEWIQDRFKENLWQNTKLKNCEQNLQCYEDVLSEYGKSFDHIYIGSRPAKAERTDTTFTYPAMLVERLSKDPRFRKIYSSSEDNVSIWEKVST